MATAPWLRRETYCFQASKFLSNYRLTPKLTAETSVPIHNKEHRFYRIQKSRQHQTLGNHKKQTTDARHTQTHTHMHRHRHTRMHTQMHTDTRVHRRAQTHTRRTGNALRPRCLTVGAEAGPAGPAAPGRHQVAGVRPRGTLGLFSPEGWRSGRPVYNARWPQELHRKLGAAEREADTLGGQGRLPGK